MWVVRELLRLVFRIVFGAAIAIVVAGVWALISGGGFSHAMRVTLLLTGCFLILLAGAGNRASMTNRVSNSWGSFQGIRGYSTMVPSLRPRPGDPTLTASAVFIGSGAVLIVLGVIV
jgi:hypothetical protein